jgi:hypothetical protein
MTRDNPPCVDRAHNYWHRLQELGRILKTARRVFLKEHFKKNDNGLRQSLESVEA